MLSPDGSRFAYVSGDTRTSEVWVRSFSSFDAQRIEGANSESLPIWSPDSNQIALSVDGKLTRFDLRTQTHQIICDLNESSITGSWSSNGIILFDYKQAIYRVSAAGGEPTQVTHSDHSRGDLYQLMPYFLPDGRRFLFLSINQRPENTAIYEGSLDSQEVKRIVVNPVGPFFVIGKDLIFSRGSILMAQPFDWKSARLTGAPVSLQERAYSASPEHVYSSSGSFSPFAAFSVSPSALAYFAETPTATELVWFDRQGKRISSVGPIAQYTNPALSPDQKLIAVGITDTRKATRDVWVLDATGGGMRLTADPKDDFNPAWSPNGERIAFASDRTGVRNLFIRPAAKVGADELVLASILFT